MRYTPPVNIWDTNVIPRNLQPGQWVYAGNEQDRGMFLGVRNQHTVVVAWLGNIRGHGSNRQAYIRSLRQYAKGV